MKQIIALLFPIVPLLVCCQAVRVEYHVHQPNGDVVIELKSNDTISVSGLAPGGTKSSSDVPIPFKNKKEGYHYGTQQFMNVVFYVKDSLNNLQWELTSDTANILYYHCLSAKAYFRGRNYTAFYTPSIPLPDGPDKFGNLPGLILWIKSDDDYIEWRAIKVVENYTGTIQQPDIAKYRYLNWPDFVAKYKETVAKYRNLVRSSGTISEDTNIKIKIDFYEIFYPELQTGEGITL